MTWNKIIRIYLAGWSIGLLTTNPKAALERVIEKHNNEGRIKSLQPMR